MSDFLSLLGGGAVTEPWCGGEQGGQAGSDRSDDSSLRGTPAPRPAAAGARYHHLSTQYTANSASLCVCHPALKG